jgi:hypothetical protein
VLQRPPPLPPRGPIRHIARGCPDGSAGAITRVLALGHMPSRRGARVTIRHHLHLYPVLSRAREMIDGKRPLRCANIPETLVQPSRDDAGLSEKPAWRSVSMCSSFCLQRVGRRPQSVFPKESEPARRIPQDIRAWVELHDRITAGGQEPGVEALLDASRASGLPRYYAHAVSRWILYRRGFAGRQEGYGRLRSSMM